MNIALYRLILAALFVTLTGCAAHTPPTPHDLQADRLRLPRQVLVTEISPDNAIASSWLIVAQSENQAVRWSRFNLLGAPDARQILENGRWRNDGFIAPNAQARELFAALLFAWTSQTGLDTDYGATHWRVIGSDDPTQRDGFSIVRLKNGVRWDVRPVSEAP